MGDHRLGLQTFTDECRDRDLPVAGAIPDWLDGHLLRNGPGQFEVGGESVAHWFDALALLRGFEIRDGTVSYSARYLRSEAYTHAQATNELGFMEFGTNPDYSLPRRLVQVARGRLTDNASVDVTRIDGTIAAVTETARSVLVDAETLSTVRTHTFDDDLSLLGSLAHAHYDFDREEEIGLGFEYGPTSHYRLFRRGKRSAEREEIGAVAVDRPSYLHSFALTDRYVVVTEPPFDVHPLRMARGRPFVENFRWHPDEPTRFHVVDRRTGERVARLRTDPFFVFHHVNAYEGSGAAVVVDLVAFEDASVIDALYLDRLRRPEIDPPGGELRRYRLDLDSETVHSDRLHPGPVEFPMIDYRGRNARQHRYVYGVGRADGPGFLNAIEKIDVETGASSTWHEPETYPGEAVFVPRPDGTGEDDGVLLSVVLDVATERSALLVLDASTLEELARAPLPHALPFGFHGQFFRGDGVPSPSML
ncbi:carotenoid oxygenase family protein [Halorientalis brevis]|uniref:Carotenoid oxygenase family protein n=1 Tax=Halorientalis brevis TaxID=1126241 RepID=A0ABD6C8S4_9EURY|nr:carotenoid oxygenase family protein [Halorientalis brevis]